MPQQPDNGQNNRLEHGRAIAPLVGARNLLHGALREVLGGNNVDKIAEKAYTSLEKGGSQDEIQFAARSAASSVFTPTEQLLKLAEQYSQRAHKGTLRTIGRMVVSGTVGISFDMASDLIQMAELTEEDQRRQTKAINGLITITDASPIPTPGLDVHLTRNASQKHTQEIRTVMLIKGLQLIADPTVNIQDKQRILDTMSAERRGETNPFRNVSLLALDNKIDSLQSVRSELQSKMDGYKTQYDELERQRKGRLFGRRGLEQRQEGIMKEDAVTALQEVLLHARYTDLMLLRSIRVQGIAQGFIAPHAEFDLPYLN